MSDLIQDQSEPDNTPQALPEENKTSAAPQSTGAGLDRALWYTIGGILLVSCCGLFLLGYFFTKTSQFKELTTFPSLPNLDYTPAPTPDMPATAQAWKPGRPPTLGSRQEVERALTEDNVPDLRWFAAYRPTMPNVSQPGDVYTFAVFLQPSAEVLWSYGWCTLTQKILDQNFAQMDVEFFLNGAPLSDDYVGIEDYNETEERFCRTYNILVKDWPSGTHLLAVDVTFLAPTDDGWDVYPAGTHTFEYYVTIER